MRALASYPIEIHSDERIAEFLLNNAVTAEDYEEAVAQVRRMGLDPAQIPHQSAMLPTRAKLQAQISDE